MTKSKGLILIYISFIYALMVSIIPVAISFINDKYSDNISTYSYIFIMLFIVLFASLTNTKKKINIIILSILNVIAVIIPFSLQYISFKYFNLPSFFIKPNEYNSFCDFITKMITTSSMKTFYLPPFIFILIAIIIFIYNRKVQLQN